MRTASVACINWLRGPQTSTYKKAESLHMKKLLSIITVTAFTLGLSVGAYAAEKKAKPAAEAATDTAKKPAEAAKAAPEKVAGEAKSIPMYTRADAIDVKAKTFTN